MTILVDVDCTVADLMTPWLAWLAYTHGEVLTVQDCTDWDMTKFVKCGNHVYDYLDIPDHYDRVKPIPGALEAVESMRADGHRIVFVTSSNACGAGQKIRWLIDHGFVEEKYPGRAISDDVIIAHDKSLIKGDLLIDDGPHNFTGKPGIIYDQPWNRSFKQRFVQRARSWAEVLDLVGL